MKVQIIYTSRSGCTRRLAEAVFNGLDTENKSIHDLSDGIPEIDGDIILFGYWGYAGHAEEPMMELIRSIHRKGAGVFCTLAKYADSQHAFDTARSAVEILKDDNDVIGSYVCNGALARAKEPQTNPKEQKELRWDIIRNHPTDAECALAAERFNERVHMYERAKELGIPFTSIL